MNNTAKHSLRKLIEQNLIETIEQYVKDQIDLVLVGEKDNVKLNFVRPRFVQAYLETKGIKHEFDDTNGRQWDYCIYFKDVEHKYRLSGDGYGEGEFAYSCYFERF